MDSLRIVEILDTGSFLIDRMQIHGITHNRDHTP